MGEGDYAVLVEGEVLEFSHWDDLPETFDNLIRWVPDVPPEPHTEAQHEAISSLPEKLRETLRREHASGNPDR